MKYYSREHLEVPECTIFQAIYEKNRDYPDDEAIRYFGNQISYRNLLENIEKCAKSLRKAGVGVGDCVTLCMAGVPESIYIVLACSRIGAIANFINPLFGKSQMAERINDTGSEWIFILDEMYSYCQYALSETCIKNVVIVSVANSMSSVILRSVFSGKTKQILSKHERNSKIYMAWKEFVGIGADFQEVVDTPYEKDTPVVMVYSSGSTGASKGILLTNDGILATNYYRNIPPDPVERQKTFLQMIPIWFSTGIVISIMIPLLNGCIVIPELRFSKEAFCNDLKKYKPNMTLTATSLWLYAVHSRKLHRADLSFLECPITGGEKVSGGDEKLINDWLHLHSCGTDLLKGYGMCELGGTVTSTSTASGYASKDGGTGYPIHNVLVSAFNIATDEELKCGERGEIRVCTPARMKEYYRNPDATKSFFKADVNGNIWGCTGDIGYVDEDGEVFILGRKTDCYVRKNGDIVYLFDIEEEILKSKEVAQCKVIDSIIDEKEAIVAHLVLKADVSDPDMVITEINEHCRRNLSDYMVPKYYKIRSSMPVHTNGKRDVESLKKDTEDLKQAKQA